MTGLFSNAAGLPNAAMIVPNRAFQIVSSIFKGVPVGNESIMLDYAFGGPGTTTQLLPAINTRKQYIINRNCAFVRIVLCNFWGTGYYPVQAPLTITASFEASNGITRVPFTFQGDLVADIRGSFGGTSNFGAYLVSDPLFIPVTTGQQCWVWTHVEGENIPVSSVFLTNSAWGEGCDASAFNAAPVDLTLSGTLSANNLSFFAPIALVGDNAPYSPYVGLFGDSVGAGEGDYTIPVTGRGFLRRAMNNTIPFVMACVPGNYYTSYNSTVYQMAQGCTDCIDEMGINDISNKTLAQIQAYAITVWTVLGSYGARVWKTTLTPYTSSTDGWTTATNQTPNANDSIRINYNTWIRAGAPILGGAAVAVGTTNAILAGQPGHPLTGYIECANAVEVNSSNVLTQNGGRWLVGTVDPTTGGIHPSSAGHADIAAIINNSIFKGAI